MRAIVEHLRAEMDPEAVARGRRMHGVWGTEVPQRGQGAEPMVGVRGKLSPPKMGVWE